MLDRKKLAVIHIVKKERIETLSKKETGKLIESLKNILKRQRRDEEEVQG